MSEIYQSPPDVSPGVSAKSSVAAVCNRAISFLRALVANPLTAAGLGIVVLLILTAAFAPHLAPYDPLAQNLGNRLMAPNAAHLMGTDELGRDILSRILYGARITLKIVFLVGVSVAPMGLLIGCTAGYLGGLTDLVLMRITDVFLAFPKLILALALVAALGPGLENAILAIAITSWPPFARLARAQTLILRREDFVASARLQGGSSAYIIRRHIVPLCLPPIMVRMTLEMAGIILTAAGLGFLGLGAQPPLPEWGAMISSGRKFLLDQWWVATMPGLAILMVSLGFNLLGDGLRDVLDPKRERARQ